MNVHSHAWELWRGRGRQRRWREPPRSIKCIQDAALGGPGCVRCGASCALTLRELTLTLTSTFWSSLPSIASRAIYREVLRFGLAHTREVRRREAGQLMRAPHAVFLRVQNIDDVCRKDGFELQNLRVGMAQITEQVPAAVPQFKILVAHRKACSAASVAI
jgi:hypothetical protein